MALSSNTSGGANTNLTGLTPEQISHAVNSNVAGGKLAQDSIQNIFENQQKMAYADYLDRLPQDQRAAAEKFRTPLEGGDKFYWDYNKDTQQWEKTPVPVAAKKTEFPPHYGASMPYKESSMLVDGVPTAVIFDSAGARYLDAVTKKDITEKVRPLPGNAGGLTPVKPAAEQAKAGANEDKRVVELADKIEGKVIDKTTRKPMVATAAEIEEFNQKSNTPYAYIVEEEVKKNLITPGVTKTEKFTKRPLPPGVTAATAHKGYKAFLAKGGKGSFDDYIYALEQEMSK
jgi:hypothetical protein